MLNALIGGMTLLAIFLAFVNMGTPFGTACAVASTVGLLVGVRNLRAQQRAIPAATTRITD